MKENIQDIWIDRVGMIAIVIVSLGYVLFGASFAQLRLEFSFLDFPIFIGEILLGFTTLLFIVKSVRQKWELGAWGWVLGAYLFFVLLKAFSGYFVWGPLAFRDAALFYYPFFIVLGYSFWSNDLGGDKARRGLVALILCVFILRQFVGYWPCSLIILGLILALQARSFQERMILLGAIILFAPYGALFNVFYRTIFLSSLITVIFISIIFFVLYYKDRWVCLLGGLVVCLFLGVVLFKLCQTGMGETCIIKNPKPVAGASFQEPSRAKYLFHPVGNSFGKLDAIKEFLQRIFKEELEAKESYVVSNEPPMEGKHESLRIKEADTLFRYYIWRDMALEYARHKPFFGFAFGRPLRSSTLKYYGRAVTTQEYDGWVGAHNSLLYMIYRAGLIGLVMVFSILAVWFGLLRDFFILRDWTGLLLCAVLLNWIVAANFFLIFEMPYTAIPVWTILGITLKHRMLLKEASNVKINYASNK